MTNAVPRPTFTDRFVGALRRRVSSWAWARRGSSVSHPELVHPTARIISSSLAGPVRVDRHAVIKDCRLAGADVRVGRGTYLWGPNIDIHGMLHPVAIGAFCSIARNVSIQEYNHRMDRASTYFFSHNVFGGGMTADIESRGAVTIGNDVWIGSHAVIGSGVTIGDGAVIGANSVVVRDVPPYAVVAGCPARLIRHRFDEPTVERLLRLRWWDWDEERIRRNERLFLDPLSPEVLDSVVP